MTATTGKVCTKCDIYLEREEFSKCTRSPTGIRSWCRKCSNEDNKKREHRYKATRANYGRTPEAKALRKESYKENKGKILESNRKWRTESINGRLSSYIKGAKSRDLEWSITKEEFISFWGRDCHYCGSEIPTVGLDRIDSSIGYVMDNILPCCTTCNRMKNSHSTNYFIEHIKKIANHYNPPKEDK